MFGFFSMTALLLGVGAGLSVLRPEKGVGNLLVSLAEDHEDGKYNAQRLMVYFDMECMASSMRGDDEMDTDFYNKKQHSALDRIISNDYPCLSHSTDYNGKVRHYQFEDLEIPDEDNVIGRSFGVSFLDVNDAISYEDNSGSCLHDSSVQIDYNEHCISMFTYERLFEKLGDGSAWTNHENTGWECITQDASSFLDWGLDASDNFGVLDGLYTYPNMTEDNGVDIYIVDDGVLSSHIEFESGQVTGQDPQPYEAGVCESSHGTHVAGIAGGQNYGHSRHLPIISYRVCECDACFGSLIIGAFADINKALSGTTRRGVINVSLGGPKDLDSYISQKYFQQIISNGGIVVVAAGNSNEDACDTAPAFSTKVITVGSTNINYTVKPT